MTTFFINGTDSLPQNIKAYAKEGYSQNPVVFACANIIASAAASVKLELHSFDAKGQKKVDTAAPILSLMAQPNKMQTWEDFALELVAWHRVAGEVFILRLPETGKPVELHILNPDAMEVKPGKGGIPEQYVFGSGPDKKTFPVNQFDGTSQILHIKTFNPLDPWRGLSPLSPAARAVDIHNQGSAWNSALLVNGARPSGVVEFTNAPSETTLSQLREYFKKAWQGAVNAGNIPLLTGGAKFTPLSHNPKDMDFQKNMGEAAKNTGLVYGVPLPLLTMDAATFSNMDSAQERLWTETVLPLLNVVIKKLGQFVMPLYGAAEKNTRTYLAYNSESVPALEPKRERLFKRMKDAVAGSLLTPNEARAEMGYAELDGADQLLIAGTMKPLDAIETQPNTELVKAMKASGYTAAEIADALAPHLKAAA
ncbi:phage portal protein [Mesorhizobium sp. BR-1-1-10]|uniref:phage portal protein n=1 Tax=Mesorhizobium sp. BR-1-1-10 TaxID=2876660 RepID=UPI001CD1277B|nr:phage portal protein [Mesorhizobium sp. BR-1-1-10]MBZ9975490.1 phage portal protein [Mesorhizobium sp. BR-1-1-10]